LRLTKSVCFALEMAKHCLPQTPAGLNLNGRWMQMNMETEGSQERLVSLLIAIHGAADQVSCTCNIERGEEGEWSEGLCYINLAARPDEVWAFYCELENGSLHVSPMGKNLQELGLDRDIIADMARAGINSVMKLLGLTAYEVCRIFQPNPIEVLGHSNPTEYIDHVTSDKFFRLRGKLEEKGLQLRGPRHSWYELQLML